MYMPSSNIYMQSLCLHEDLFVCKECNVSLDNQKRYLVMWNEDFDRAHWNKKRDFALMNSRIWNDKNVE